MTTTTPSAALIPVAPVFTNTDTAPVDRDPLGLLARQAGW